MKELRDWIDVVFKVVLAVAGVIVGYYFSFQKQQNDDIKLIVEMATASDSAKRIMGASIAQAYFAQDRIPQEVYLAVIKYANNTDDIKLQAVVNAGAAAASADQPDLRQAIKNATDALPIRIYFHIRQESDKAAAQNLEKIIETSLTPTGASLLVPGIELVKGQQSQSVLKCFKKSECNTLGPELVKLFKDNNITIELSDQSKTYEQSTAIRPNHFEAWFAPGIP